MYSSKLSVHKFRVENLLAKSLKFYIQKYIRFIIVGFYHICVCKFKMMLYTLYRVLFGGENIIKSIKTCTEEIKKSVALAMRESAFELVQNVIIYSPCN